MKNFAFIIPLLIVFLSCSNEIKEEQKRGLEFKRNGDYRAAINSFTKCIDLKNDDVLSIYWRGQSYLKIKEYDKAKADFYTIDRLSPEMTTHYFERGLIYFSEKNYNDAELSFSRFISDKSNSDYFDLSVAYFFRAASRCKLGLIDESIEDYRKYETLTKDDYTKVAPRLVAQYHNLMDSLTKVKR